MESLRLFEESLPAVKNKQPPPLPEGFELREIQKIAHKNLIDTYLSGKRKPVLMAATGSGKTKLAGYIIHQALSKNPEQRIAFIVPRETLLQQAYDEFTGFFGFECSIIRGIDERTDLRKQVQVCTIQTLGRRLKNNPVFKDLEFGLAFIDEAHIEFKDRELLCAEFVVGLTATPYAKKMGLYYDSLVKTIPATQLTDQGVITPLHVIGAKKITQIDRSNLHTTSTGEYKEEEEQEATDAIIANVVEEYSKSEDMQGRKFIGFAKTINSCIGLAAEFEAKGYNVGYVHSKMSQEDCKSILDLFKAGLLVGVWSVVKLIEGFDFPAVDALIVATVFAPSKNDPETPNALTKYVQMLGRGRRKSEGKEYCLVHDHGGNYEKYRNPDYFEIGFDKLFTGEEKEDNANDKPAERKLKPVDCPNCGGVVYGGRLCRCGYELESFSEVVKGEIIEYVDGEMVQLTSPPPKKNNINNNNKKLTMQQKQELFSGLKYHYQDLRAERGERPCADGFIARQYREVTGVWPRGIDQQKSEKTKIGSDYAVYLAIRYAESKKRKNSF